MYYLGIDVGGTTVKAGLIDEDGRIFEVQKQATVLDDLDGFILMLTRQVEYFLEKASFRAVGVGIAGLISSETRSVKVAPNIPCLANVKLEALLSNRIGTTVITENDANAGAYAELCCGAARGTKNMAYLTIGTGLGSGLILNGQLFIGTSGYAGELGHTVVEPEGSRCSCGSRGCLETIVSATGMVRLARGKIKRGSQTVLSRLVDQLTSEMIFDAAKGGDEMAQQVFEEVGRYLGVACANLMNLLNVEMIVIGGGVMASREMLLGPALREAKWRAFDESFRACQIVHAQLGPEAGMIGAAMLARDRTR